MAVETRGFVAPEEQYEGLYKAGDTLERRRLREMQFGLQREGRKNATLNYLSNYLDKKDFLTGTNYDPEIIKQLNEAMIEGTELASKGADTSNIMLALGPKINRLNEYSTKARLIDNQLKSSLQRLKPYKGYNTDALYNEAKRAAFYDESGSLKDISLVDPSQDFISETVKKYPERVTTSAGLDDFIDKTPMAESSKEVQTMLAGKRRSVKYDAKHPFWMDIARDEKGEVMTDVSGNPIGLDVVSEMWRNDNGEIMRNPKTGEPFRMIDKAMFNSIMRHNPDIADNIRGLVNESYRRRGGEMPAEGSAQWEGMARNILYDELKNRNKSSFKIRDLELKSPSLTRLELGLPVGGSGGSASGEEINRLYERIDKKVSDNISVNKPATLVKELDADAQLLISKYGDLKGFSDKIPNDKLVVIKDNEGNLNLYETISNTFVAKLPKTGINLSAQPGIKEKRAVIDEEKKQKKEIRRTDIPAKASAAGYSVKEYEQLLKQKGIEIKD